MSSTPFTAHDNMRLPAYRASHLARFHPYPRAHPSLHEVRIKLLSGFLHANTPTRRPSAFLSILGALFGV